MDIQSLIAQFAKESAVLLQVYQQRFQVECPTLPDDLSALCARTRASEWEWSRGFEETAALLLRSGAPKGLLRDIVVENLTAKLNLVVAVQDDVAATLGFAAPTDGPVQDIEACVTQVRRFCPDDAGCTASCDYLLDVLARVRRYYDVYDATLGGPARDESLPAASLSVCAEPCTGSALPPCESALPPCTRSALWLQEPPAADHCWDLNTPRFGNGTNLGGSITGWQTGLMYSAL